ncbi:MAG: sulfotransferase [Hyphomonas sp.]
MSIATQNPLQALVGAMQAGNFTEALARAEAILAEQPNETNALYMAIVSARKSNDLDRAERYLQRLKHALPDFGRAYEEEGHLRLDQNDLPRAKKAFDAATQCNPGLIASWVRLAEVSDKLGDAHTAREAVAHANRLRHMPRELVAATMQIHEGQIQQAERIVRSYLQQHPQDVEAMRLLAEIATRLNVLDDAEAILEQAIQLAPQTSQLRIDLVEVLRKRQKFSKSIEHAKYLYEQNPDSPTLQTLYAIESMNSNELDQSIALFDKVLESRPDDAKTYANRGLALKTHGRTEEAVQSYRRAVEINPLFGQAWFGLANLKTYRFDDADIAAMREALTNPDMGYEARANTLFTLAKALEGKKAHEEAFAVYREGNALILRQSGYKAENMEALFAAQKKHCTSDMFARQSGSGNPSPDPIFILGLPRAGSTLLEQILASHSLVDGTKELPDIAYIAHDLRGRVPNDPERYPRILGEMSAEDLRRLGDSYIDSTRIHREGAPLFTDKMPNNFMHIGLIHLILPNAKIIDARRNPMDCCWSGYKQLFARGQDFTYGLEEIGRYYRGYVDLMDHWNAVLPRGRILKVQHEDLFDDLEGQVRRILAYCGLPFEEACVNFHETERPVHTPSSEQVRQPINRSGFDQWKPYEAHLGPLKAALGPLAQA